MSGVQVMVSSVRRDQNISLSTEWQYTFFEAMPMYGVLVACDTRRCRRQRMSAPHPFLKCSRTALFIS
jgi:hypothetical protein